MNGLHLESNTTLQIEEATVNQISTTSTNISSYEITSATVGHIGIPVDFSGVTQTFQLANKLKLNDESLTVTAPEINVMKDVNLTLQAQELDMLLGLDLDKNGGYTCSDRSKTTELECLANVEVTTGAPDVSMLQKQNMNC